MGQLQFVKIGAAHFHFMSFKRPPAVLEWPVPSCQSGDGHFSLYVFEMASGHFGWASSSLSKSERPIFILCLLNGLRPFWNGQSPLVKVGTAIFHFPLPFHSRSFFPSAVVPLRIFSNGKRLLCI